MLDNDLIQLFRPIIIFGLSALGFPDVEVKQSFQPTQQGANTPPTIYFFKLSDRRRGWPAKFNTPAAPGFMTHTELQYYETTFEVMSTWSQDPSVISYTAADLVNYVAYILQSDSCISTLAQSNVGILKVFDVQNRLSLDDRDVHEAYPSFDVIFTHQQVISNTINSIVPDIVDNVSPL